MPWELLLRRPGSRSDHDPTEPPLFTKSGYGLTRRARAQLHPNLRDDLLVVFRRIVVQKIGRGRVRDRMVLDLRCIGNV
jgi:hypothetical protein